MDERVLKEQLQVKLKISKWNIGKFFQIIFTVKMRIECEHDVTRNNIGNLTQIVNHWESSKKNRNDSKTFYWMYIEK